MAAYVQKVVAEAGGDDDQSIRKINEELATSFSHVQFQRCWLECAAGDWRVRQGMVTAIAEFVSALGKSGMKILFQNGAGIVWYLLLFDATTAVALAAKQKLNDCFTTPEKRKAFVDLCRKKGGRDFLLHTCLTFTPDTLSGYLGGCKKDDLHAERYDNVLAAAVKASTDFAAVLDKDVVASSEFIATPKLVAKALDGGSRGVARFREALKRYVLVLATLFPEQQYVCSLETSEQEQFGLGGAALGAKEVGEAKTLRKFLAIDDRGFVLALAKNLVKQARVVDLLVGRTSRNDNEKESSKLFATVFPARYFLGGIESADFRGKFVDALPEVYLLAGGQGGHVAEHVLPIYLREGDVANYYRALKFLDENFPALSTVSWQCRSIHAYLDAALPRGQNPLQYWSSSTSSKVVEEAASAAKVLVAAPPLPALDAEKPGLAARILEKVQKGGKAAGLLALDVVEALFQAYPSPSTQEGAAAPETRPSLDPENIVDAIKMSILSPCLSPLLDEEQENAAGDDEAVRVIRTVCGKFASRGSASAGAAFDPPTRSVVPSKRDALELLERFLSLAIRPGGMRDLLSSLDEDTIDARNLRSPAALVSSTNDEGELVGSSSQLTVLFVAVVAVGSAIGAAQVDGMIKPAENNPTVDLQQASRILETVDKLVEERILDLPQGAPIANEREKLKTEWLGRAFSDVLCTTVDMQLRAAGDDKQRKTPLDPDSQAVLRARLATYSSILTRTSWPLSDAKVQAVLTSPNADYAANAAFLKTYAAHLFQSSQTEGCRALVSQYLHDYPEVLLPYAGVFGSTLKSSAHYFFDDVIVHQNMQKGIWKAWVKNYATVHGNADDLADLFLKFNRVVCVHCRSNQGRLAEVVVSRSAEDAVVGDPGSGGDRKAFACNVCGARSDRTWEQNRETAFVLREEAETGCEAVEASHPQAEADEEVDAFDVELLDRRRPPIGARGPVAAHAAVVEGADKNETAADDLMPFVRYCALNNEMEMLGVLSRVIGDAAIQKALLLAIAAGSKRGLAKVLPATMEGNGGQQQLSWDATFERFFETARQAENFDADRWTTWAWCGLIQDQSCVASRFFPAENNSVPWPPTTSTTVKPGTMLTMSKPVPEHEKLGLLRAVGDDHKLALASALELVAAIENATASKRRRQQVEGHADTVAALMEDSSTRPNTLWQVLAAMDKYAGELDLADQARTARSGYQSVVKGCHYVGLGRSAGYQLSKLECHGVVLGDSGDHDLGPMVRDDDDARAGRPRQDDGDDDTDDELNRRDGPVLREVDAADAKVAAALLQAEQEESERVDESCKRNQDEDPAEVRELVRSYVEMLASRGEFLLDQQRHALYTRTRRGEMLLKNCDAEEEEVEAEGVDEIVAELSPPAGGGFASRVQSPGAASPPGSPPTQDAAEERAEVKRLLLQDHTLTDAERATALDCLVHRKEFALAKAKLLSHFLNQTKISTASSKPEDKKLNAAFLHFAASVLRAVLVTAPDAGTTRDELLHALERYVDLLSLERRARASLGECWGAWNVLGLLGVLHRVPDASYVSVSDVLRRKPGILSTSRSESGTDATLEEDSVHPGTSSSSCKFVDLSEYKFDGELPADLRSAIAQIGEIEAVLPGDRNGERRLGLQQQHEKSFEPFGLNAFTMRMSPDFGPNMEALFNKSKSSPGGGAGRGTTSDPYEEAARFLDRIVKSLAGGLHLNTGFGGTGAPARGGSEARSVVTAWHYFLRSCLRVGSSAYENRCAVQWVLVGEEAEAGAAHVNGDLILLAEVCNGTNLEKIPNARRLTRFFDRVATQIVKQAVLRGRDSEVVLGKVAGFLHLQESGEEVSVHDLPESFEDVYSKTDLRENTAASEARDALREALAQQFYGLFMIYQQLGTSTGSSPPPTTPGGHQLRAVERDCGVDFETLRKFLLPNLWLRIVVDDLLEKVFPNEFLVAELRRKHLLSQKFLGRQVQACKEMVRIAFANSELSAKFLVRKSAKTVTLELARDDLSTQLTFGFAETYPFTDRAGSGASRSCAVGAGVQGVVGTGVGVGDSDFVFEPACYLLESPADGGKNASQSQSSNPLGVPKNKFRRWELNMKKPENAHLPLPEIVEKWMRNFESHFEGVEDCMICYSVVCDGRIPDKQCPTCANKFHAKCLKQWFDSSGKIVCPLCKQPWS
eukprot:g12699.t1